MILLDTDTLTLLLRRQPQVSARHRAAQDTVAISVITRIEVLRGRFASVLTAADGAELQRAQELLEGTIRDLAAYPVVLIDAAAAGEFDRLRQDRRLRKIGRADLLIACIALANDATLVTRNLRHFQQIPGLRLDNWAD
jgi:tRNA(fMet)-specific endonuclease VapC